MTFFSVGRGPVSIDTVTVHQPQTPEEEPVPGSPVLFFCPPYIQSFHFAILFLEALYSPGYFIPSSTPWKKRKNYITAPLSFFAFHRLSSSSSCCLNIGGKLAIEWAIEYYRFPPQSRTPLRQVLLSLMLTLVETSPPLSLFFRSLRVWGNSTWNNPASHNWLGRKPDFEKSRNHSASSSTNRRWHLILLKSGLQGPLSDI